MPSRNREVVSRPTGGHRRVFDIVAVWGLTAVTVLLFVHVTAVGPILVRLSSTHGIHLGDVVFTLFAAVVAALVTLRIARQS